jgi:hypothetical protein
MTRATNDGAWGETASGWSPEEGAEFARLCGWGVLGYVVATPPSCVLALALTLVHPIAPAFLAKLLFAVVQQAPVLLGGVGGVLFGHVTTGRRPSARVVRAAAAVHVGLGVLNLVALRLLLTRAGAPGPALVMFATRAGHLFCAWLLWRLLKRRAMAKCRPRRNPR